MDSTLKEWLDTHQIKYKLHTHPAVFTVEEAKEHCSFIPGLRCKNLFLRGKEIYQTYQVISIF